MVYCECTCLLLSLKVYLPLSKLLLACLITSVLPETLIPPSTMTDPEFEPDSITTSSPPSEITLCCRKLEFAACSLPVASTVFVLSLPGNFSFLSEPLSSSTAACSSSVYEIKMINFILSV